MEEEIKILVEKLMALMTGSEAVAGFAFILLADGQSSDGVVQGYFGCKSDIHGALLRLEREIVRQIDGLSPVESNTPFVKTDFQA